MYQRRPFCGLGSENLEFPFSDKGALKPQLGRIFEVDDKLIKREIPIPKDIATYINQYIKIYDIKNNYYLISKTDVISDPRKKHVRCSSVSFVFIVN